MAQLWRALQSEAQQRDEVREFLEVECAALKEQLQSTETELAAMREGSAETAQRLVDSQAQAQQLTDLLEEARNEVRLHVYKGNGILK